MPTLSAATAVRCGDGLGVDADLVRAAQTATRQALLALGGAAPDLAFVFGCGAEPDEVADALERAGQLCGAPTALGCGATGVIGAGQGVQLTSAVSVWLASLPGVSLRSFHLEVLPTSESVAVVGMPVHRPADRAAVLLADPWSFPVEAFVARVGDALPGVPVCGGNAAGLRGAGSTRLLVDGVVRNRGAVGVVLAGEVAPATVVSHAARPVGPVMTVTAAEGNLLLGLAGRPALTKVEEVVAGLPPAEQALASGGLLLGVAVDEYADRYGPGDFLVRRVARADPERGSLLVGEALAVGRTVQLQVPDAAVAHRDLVARLGRVQGEVSGALLFSCVGRGAELFGTADHDVLAVRAGLRTPVVAGFFAGGELGPVGARSHLHGYTASVLALLDPA